MSHSADTNAVFCSDQVRQADFGRYAASLFVPQYARRSWLALAAFNAQVAHVRDHIRQPLAGEIRLQWWRDLLTGGGGQHSEGAAGHPVAAELLSAIQQHDLPIELLTRLIDAYGFDVYDDPMPDIAALEAHCRDTAAALYALQARILGSDSSDVLRLAEVAGVADGLTNVLASLLKHSARGQLYIPADLMTLHNLSSGQLFARERSTALDQAVGQLRAEAVRQLERAFEQLPAIAPDIRPAFLRLALDRQMLRRLETSDPFAPPSLSQLQTLWTLWRAARSRPFKS